MLNKLLITSIVCSLLLLSGCNSSDGNNSAPTVTGKTTQKVEKVSIIPLNIALFDHTSDENTETYIFGLSGEKPEVEIKGITVYMRGFGNNDGIKTKSYGQTSGWIIADNYLEEEDTIITAMMSLENMKEIGDILKLEINKEKYDISKLPNTIEVWAEIADGQKTYKISTSNITLNNL